MTSTPSIGMFDQDYNNHDDDGHGLVQRDEPPSILSRKRQRADEGDSDHNEDEYSVNTTTQALDARRLTRLEQRLESIEALLQKIVEQRAGPSTTFQETGRITEDEPLRPRPKKGRPPKKRFMTKKEPSLGPEWEISNVPSGEDAGSSQTTTRQARLYNTPAHKVNVTLTSPDGSRSEHVLSINIPQNKFNVNSLGLGPAVVVDSDYDRGFGRSTIKHAFGGHHSWSFHNWKSANIDDGVPFLTMTLSRHPHLPTRPGQHGLILQDLRVFSDGTPVDRAIPLFVGRGKSDWRLMGTYNVVRWCEVHPSDIKHLPPKLLDSWIRSYDYESGGNDWIDSANEILKRITPRRPQIERTYGGIRSALLDGRLSLSFTILQCVGYPYAWFDELFSKEEEAPNVNEDDEQTLIGSQPASSRFSRFH